MSGDKVLISEASEQALLDAAEEAVPNEIGGILVGVYAGRRPWVVRVVTIPPEEGSAGSYLLPAGTTRAAIDEVRSHDPRLGYLGEWHSHPADQGPSQRDFSTLQSLAGRMDRGRREVLLLLARYSGTYGLEGWVVSPRRERRATIVRTGEIEPQSANGSD